MEKIKKEIGVYSLEQKYNLQKTPPLKRIGFTINYRCNVVCTYCFVKPDKASKYEKEISKEEFKEILKQAIPLGLEEVQFSGGEPLLKKDILEFIKIAKDLGIKVGIFTNGILLTKKLIKNLKLLKLDWIRISLGGSSYKQSQLSGRLGDTKNTFKKILSNTKTSVKSGIVTGLFTPVTKNNYRDIRKTTSLAKKLGVRYIIFCNYIPLGTEQDRLHRMSVIEHYEAIEELLKARDEQRGAIDVYAYYGFFEYLSPKWKKSDPVLKGPCGRERLAFIANGDIRTCLCTTHKIGSFRQKNFNLKKIWEKHPLLLEIRKNKIFELCLHCKRNNICQPCLTPTININKKISIAPSNCPAVMDYNLSKKKLSEIEAIKKALRNNFKKFRQKRNLNKNYLNEKSNF